MKFNAVLMTLDQNTKIRLVVTMYGMKFSSEHYPEYYLDLNLIVTLLILKQRNRNTALLTARNYLVTES